MVHRPLAVSLSIILVLSTVAVGGAVGSSGAAPAAAEQASVTFTSQTSGGSTITVDEVTLPDGGFVTIHDSTVSDDALGSVVGTSTYLEAGTHENVTIRLSEPLSESGDYVAMAHKDTNDNRAYEFVSSNAEADGPYTADGGAVIAAAPVTVSASVTMSDQPTSGTSVVVDRVELSQPGYVAIHNETLLTEGDAVGSVVGNSEKLSAGVHTNVRIELDDNVTAETVAAMVHVETNGNDNYEFPDADGPFLNADEKAVLDTASLSTPSEASVTFDAQASGGTTVTVSEVFLPEGGFVAMHDEKLADGKAVESVVGASEHLAAGYHRNVEITFDEAIESGMTLTAMAHKDTNGNQNYEFPDADGPYTAAGSAVTDAGDVIVSADVSMSTQQSDGTQVVIDSVDLAEGGFVAVHDASLFGGNVAGSVVGSSEYLEAGQHENVVITFDRPVNESTLLVAMAHKDTNGNEAYEFPDADGPYTANGGAVVSPAKALVTAHVSASDQQSMDGSTVVLDSVTLQDGGFVTIHDASVADGAVFDSVRGTSEYLPPGTHENVKITLDEPLESDQAVIPMAHRDTNGNEAYDFVSSEGSADGPYVAAGGAVVTKASVDVQNTPTETPTATPSPTATATESSEAMTTSEESMTSTEGPGFGVVVALVALLATALLTRTRR